MKLSEAKIGDVVGIKGEVVKSPSGYPQSQVSVLIGKERYVFFSDTELQSSVAEVVVEKPRPLEVGESVFREKYEGYWSQGNICQRGIIEFIKGDKAWVSWENGKESTVMLKFLTRYEPGCICWSGPYPSNKEEVAPLPPAVQYYFEKSGVL